ncbi:MAG: pyroglutamyl-peptidase I, partial [Comamonadaceae bacterium]
FIHIPYLPEQAVRFPGAPSLPLDTLVAALRIAVATALTVQDDVRETGGQLH